MSTVLDAPPTAPSERLQTTMTAVRLSFTWFGTRKTLSQEQKAEAADAFGADGPFLSAGKKLLDTRNPRFRLVTAVRSQAISYWKSVSLPYPEPGLRLIPHSGIQPFAERMALYREDLRQAVRVLESSLPELRAQARERLGRLYNPADYPESLTGEFDLTWEFPSIEPPDYLKQLAPELYERECQRVRGRFEEAVALAEQAFLEEFAKLVTHLTERLSGDDDGQPKVFRDSAVENLRGFFDRFRQLNVRSNDQLESLVQQTQDILEGNPARALRQHDTLRERVARRLTGVQAALDGMLVDRPRRSILRPGRVTEGG
jgi:tetratricopeptide (TPR) repeat protein